MISPKRPKINPTLLPLAFTCAVFLLLCGAGSIAYADRNFLSIGAANNLLFDNSYVGIAAIGVTFVIISGGIDLSAGAVVAFCAILIASLVKSGVHPALAWAVAVGASTLLGFVNGNLIARFDLPPFMVTLAAMFVARAGAFAVSEQNLGINNDFYRWLATLRIPLGSPGVHLKLATMLMAIAYVVAIVVAHQFPFGRYVYAIGGNEQSAALLGVPVKWTKIGVYTLAGAFSGVAGVVSTIWKPSGDPASYVGMELDVIAAAVIGGTLLSGGVGYVAGTLVGVLILGVIQMLIDYNGSISSGWTKVTVGGLLLAFIVLQRGLIARGERH